MTTRRRDRGKNKVVAAKGRHGERLALVLAVLIALLLSVMYLRRSDGLTPDSYEYMRSGISLVSGEGYMSVAGGVQTIFPPSYPVLIGLANLATKDPVVAGRYVSLAASVASVALIFLLGRALFSSLTGVMAAFLLAILPLRLQSSVMVLTESTFLALGLLGLLLWVISGSRPWVGLLAGISLGAAYLTRPEGSLIFAICALGTVVSLLCRGAGRRASAIRLITIAMGFILVSLPFWLHLQEHTGRWRLTAKMDRNLAIASGRAEEVPFHELRRLDADDADIVYPPTATSFKEHLFRLLENLRLIPQMLADMTSLFLVACLGLGILTIGARPRSQRITIYWLVLVGICLLLIAAAFFVEYRMLLLPVALLILFAAGSLTAANSPRRDTGLMFRKVAMWLLVLGSLQLGLGSALLMASPIGSPMDDISSFRAALEKESEATGPIIGNYREPRALALDTARDCLDLPWEPLPRVLRYAAHHHASFLLVRSGDHPDLAELAWKPVTTDQLMPLAHVEVGEGEERRALQLYRIRSPEPVE